MSAKTINSVIVIFGATGDIGEGLSAYALEHGVTVVAVGRSEKKLQGLQTRLVNIKGQVELVELENFADGPAVEKLLNRVLVRYGRLDAVIIASGAWHRARVDDPPAVIAQAVKDECADHTVIPAVIGQATQQLMRQRAEGVTIFYFSSHVVVKPHLLKNLAYRAGKGGGEGFFVGLDGELKASGVRNIRICILRPGIVNTAKTQPALGLRALEAVQIPTMGQWILANLHNPEIPLIQPFDTPVELE